MKESRFISCILLFIFFSSVFVLFSNGHYGGDGLENYLTAESIVLDGDIVIHDRPFGVDQMRYEVRGKVDSAGKYYSPYGIGMPIILVPLYAVGHIISKIIPQVPHDYITQFSASLANPIITAFTALTLFVFLGRLGYSLRTSFLTTLVFSFCTMSLIYTRSGFSEPAVGLFLLLAFLFLHRYEKSGLIRYILFATILIGYTLLIKKNSFLYLPLMFIYLLSRSRREKSTRQLIRLWLAGLMPILFFVLIYLSSKAFIAPDIYGAATGAFSSLLNGGAEPGRQMLKGLYYYLFSPGKGYFFYSLPLLLALFTIKDMRLNRMI